MEHVITPDTLPEFGPDCWVYTPYETANGDAGWWSKCHSKLLFDYIMESPFKPTHWQKSDVRPRFIPVKPVPPGEATKRGTKKSLPNELLAKAAPLLELINADMTLQGLLYDLDLMPEQLEEGSKEWFDMVNIAAHFKVALHAPARPAAARECGAWEAVRNAAEACEELHGTSMPKAMRIAARTGILMRYLGVREDTAAREDTARLDWLEKNGGGVEFRKDSGFKWNVFDKTAEIEEGSDASLRAAIDAAMQQGGKTP